MITKAPSARSPLPTRSNQETHLLFDRPSALQLPDAGATRYAHRMLIGNSISERSSSSHLDASASIVGLKVNSDLQITLDHQHPPLSAHGRANRAGIPTGSSQGVLRNLLDLSATVTVERPK